MTISSGAEPKAGPFTGNGSTTAFPFTFKTFAAADLLVVKLVADVESTLVLDSDYSIALNGDQNNSPGGTCTYPISGTPLASGQTLTIVSNIDYTQETDVINGGGFYPEVLEDTFDRGVMQTKQLLETLGRALTIPVSADGVSTALPSPDAGQLIGWNSAANGLANYAPDTDSAAGLQANLANTASAALGPALVGFNGALNYAVNTIGWRVKIESVNLFDYLTAAQIADVQARTLTLDVTTAIQAWATACEGKRGHAPAGSYKMTAAITFKEATTITGDGPTVTRFVTAANIEQVNADAAGAYNVTFRDIGFYNTYPVANVAGPTPTGTTAIGSPQITAVSSVAGLYKGMQITGSGIPAGSYIRKFTAGPNVIYLCDSAGNAVNATANAAGVALTTQFREGCTKFHAHVFNGGRWLFDNCYFKSAFVDTDFSPNNHAGIWFDRTAGTAYFINEVHKCWVDHGQILMGTSDSNIKNCHVWGNPFEYAIKVSAPGVQVEGCNASAGVTYGAIWVKASATEASGASLATIVGNNIDGGGIFYTGYGLFVDTGLSVEIVGNRINQCFKGGIYIKDSAATIIGSNTFLDNNIDGLGYSDIEVDNVATQTVGLSVGGNAFYQSAAKVPTIGYAIREINSGFAPANCAYHNNTVTGGGNYNAPAFTIASTVASGQYPSVIGNVGGTTETESIGNVTTGKFVGTLTGCTTAPTADVYWSRSGDLITLRMPAVFQATSNTTACTITGMPAAIRPAVQCGASVIITDNSVNALGTANIQTSGVITLLTNTPTGVFTNVNLKGVYLGSVTYSRAG